MVGRGRTGRVEAVLDRLVGRGVLTPDQAEQVRAELAADVPGAGGILIETLGYLGGGLMLAGAAVLLATTWDVLTDAVRSGLLAAITVALVGAGLAIAGRPLRPRSPAGAPARQRLVGVLLAIASGTAAGAAAVAASGHSGVAAGAAGLAVAVAGYLLVTSVPGLLASAVFSVVLGVAAVNESVTEVTPLGIAVLLVGLAVLWGGLAATGLAVPRPVGYAIAAAIGLFGAQQPLGQAGTEIWAYLLTLAVAGACLGLLRWQRGWVPLVAGVAGVTLAVPEIIWDITNGAVGGAAILLLAGGVLVAASGFGLRLRQHHPPGGPA